MVIKEAAARDWRRANHESLFAVKSGDKNTRLLLGVINFPSNPQEFTANLLFNFVSMSLYRGNIDEKGELLDVKIFTSQVMQLWVGIQYLVLPHFKNRWWSKTNVKINNCELNEVLTYSSGTHRQLSSTQQQMSTVENYQTLQNYASSLRQGVEKDSIYLPITILIYLCHWGFAYKGT